MPPSRIEFEDQFPVMFEFYRACATLSKAQEAKVLELQDHWMRNGVKWVDENRKAVPIPAWIAKVMVLVNNKLCPSSLGRMCMSLNHPAGYGCNKQNRGHECHLLHQCIMCGKADHGLYQVNQKGAWSCLKFAKWRKEEQKFREKGYGDPFEQEVQLTALAGLPRHAANHQVPGAKGTARPPVNNLKPTEKSLEPLSGSNIANRAHSDDGNDSGKFSQSSVTTADTDNYWPSLQSAGTAKAPNEVIRETTNTLGGYPTSQIDEVPDDSRPVSRCLPPPPSSPPPPPPPDLLKKQANAQQPQQQQQPEVSVQQKHVVQQPPVAPQQQPVVQQQQPEPEKKEWRTGDFVANNIWPGEEHRNTNWGNATPLQVAAGETVYVAEVDWQGWALADKFSNGKGWLPAAMLQRRVYVAQQSFNCGAEGYAVVSKGDYLIVYHREDGWIFGAQLQSPDLTNGGVVLAEGWYPPAILAAPDT